MDEELKTELQALVVGFLQQSLKENPEGFSVRDFERIFPERCDEPADWYKRYKKRNAIEALECIPETVKVYPRNGTTYISLNLKSSKVDPHLVDLIRGQRSSGRKKAGRISRPSSRALASFSLNRQYSGHYSSHTSGQRFRLNHGQSYRGDRYAIRRPSPAPQSPAQPPPRPSSYSTSPASHSYSNSSQASNSWMAAGDPRSRSSMASNTPPTPSPKPQSVPVPQRAPPSSVIIPNRVALSRTSSDSSVKTKEKQDDPVLAQRKSVVRQRIVRLLTEKFAEMKLLHLNSLYQLEFQEGIDLAALGHPTLTSLMQDPVISAYVQTSYKSGFVIIKVKPKASANGKENLISEDPRGQLGLQDIASNHGLNKPIGNSAARAKFDAIDPFNVRSMIQSLEPLTNIKEPPLHNNQIDEMVKYKTMRLVFRSPNSTLKLDDWEQKFEQETRLRIHIRNFGCKTNLEFFRQLASDIPIKISLNKQDEWIASAEPNLVSEWMHEKLSNNQYRAITALEARYELVAYPGDTYTFASIKDVSAQDFQPAFLLSVRSLNSMWIQLRTPKKIEEHLCVEASMTCYEDYKEKNLYTVPKYFVKPGFPCAVFDIHQQRWCRALITEAPKVIDRNREVSLLLVDYGLKRKCTISQLSFLMKSHLRLPVGPIYSKLTGIKDEGSLNVQRCTKLILQEFTSPPVTLACKFIKELSSKEPEYMPKSCFEVTLVDTRHGKDCNLADDINRYEKGDIDAVSKPPSGQE